MQYWLIEDGEKNGPLEDYEVRDMIRKGKVTGESKIWHEGADGWVSASEVRVFENEFEKKLQPPPIPEELKEPPPFLYWRRFGARWFDVVVYGLIMMIIYRIGGLSILPDLKKEPSIEMVFLKAFPFIFMEAALISSLGFTPGKWLMSLKVTKADGELLTTGSSLMRSLRVWVLGMGMSHVLLMPIAHIVALWMGRKKGAPLWDLPLGHQVTGPAVVPNRLMLYFASLFLMFVVNYILVAPELDEWTKEAIKIQNSQ